MPNLKALFSRPKPARATELDLLKWGAGSVRPLPEVDGVNENQLLQLVEKHRLPHRLLHRIEQEHPAWCSPSLFRGLLQLRAQAETMMRRQVAATREVAAALKSAQPLLTIKGFSTYALTGENHHIRLSGDLDLLSDDVEQLWNTLEQLGYEGVKTRDTFGFSRIQNNHTAELGLMQRGSLAIEPHKYYPVLSYPQEVVESDLNPVQHSTLWLQNLPGPLQREMLYGDLLANSRLSRVSGSCDLVVPDAAMLALILCAHEFKVFLMGPFLQGHIKLSTLADIRDLTGHAHFDKKQFLSLITEFDGHDAVGFAGRLLEDCLGTNPLSIYQSQVCPPQIADLPRLMTPPPSFCWSLAYDTDELLCSGNMDITAKNVSRLGANTIEANTKGDRKIYKVSLPAEGELHPQQTEGETLSRIIVHSPRDERIPLQFSVTWNEKGLLFEGALVQPTWEEGYEYCIRVLGYQWSGLCPGADLPSGEDEKLLWFLPWKWLPATSQERRCLSLLLFVAKQNRHCQPAVMDPIMLVPLQVLRP